MIQVYNGFNTDFNKNGRILNNVSSCYIIEELNGAYYLELEHYKDKQEKYKELKGWNIIKADGQLFRIPNIENIQEDNIKIKVTAYHIFYDLLNDFIEDRRIENSTVENALRTAIEINPKFIVGECDIESINTAYFIKENPVKVIFDKILPRWGGELYRNNYEVAIRKNIGKDTGILIKYGKNIKGFKEHIDYTGVATRILPIGKNGLTIELVNGGDKYLYSPRRQGYLFPIQSYQEYPFEATREVKFEEIEDATELKNEAMKLWGIIDVPKVTYEINLIDLSKTIEYKEYKDLYSLRVGDIVKIRHEIFNVDLEAKVMKTKKNVLTGILEEIVLGDYRDNFAKTINNIGKSLNKTQTYVEKIDEELQDTKTIVFQNQEQISLQAQRIENIETNTNELEQRISEAELKITPESIVSTVRSSTSYNNDLQGIKQSTIEQLSDEINLKVDKDGIISAINMSPEEIKIQTNKLSIAPTSGNNILLNSGFEYGTAHWYINGNVTFDTEQTDYIYNGNKTALVAGIEDENGLPGIYQPFNTTIGKKYTLSFIARSHNGYNTGSVIGIEGVYTVDIKDVFDFTKYTYTFTATQEQYEFVAYVKNATGNWGAFYIDNIKVEEGEFATDWSENPRDINTAYTTIDGKGITIKAGGLYLTDTNDELKGSFATNVLGSMLEVDNIATNNIFANNVWEVYQGSNELYVNANATCESSDGSFSTPFKSIQEAIDYIGKVLPYAVTINVSAGTYNEHININYLQGGTLFINLAKNTVINGSLHIQNCQSPIGIVGETKATTMKDTSNVDRSVTVPDNVVIKTNTSSRRPFYVNNCNYVRIRGVQLDASNLADTPVTYNQSKGRIEECYCIGGTSNSSIYINNINHVYIPNSIGDKATTIGDCSVVTVWGVYTKGGISEGTSSFVNQANKTYAINIGGSTTPTTKTITMNATKTASARNGKWRTDNSRVYQGQWDGNGNHTGYIRYSDTDIATLQGKTITKATLTIKRYTGGGTIASKSDGLRLRYFKGEIGGANAIPDVLGSELIITRPAQGQSLTVDITNWIKTIINQGTNTFSGLCFYTSSTSNDYYCILEDLAHCSYSLSVTYQ